MVITAKTVGQWLLLAMLATVLYFCFRIMQRFIPTTRVLRQNWIYRDSVHNSFKNVCAGASDGLSFFPRNLKNSIELCDPKQCLDVIGWPQKDELAASISNGSPDCDQLT